MNAKDKLGTPLNVGDLVVFMQVGYRNLLVGDIIHITPKTIQIKHERTNTGSTETKQFHDQVVSIMR